jgi:hypothetical protein
VNFSYQPAPGLNGHIVPSHFGIPRPSNRPFCHLTSPATPFPSFISAHFPSPRGRGYLARCSSSAFDFQLSASSPSHFLSHSSLPERREWCTFLQFFAFFCIPQKLIFRLFKQFQPLAAKHPGGGVPDPVAPSLRHHVSATGVAIAISFLFTSFADPSKYLPSFHIFPQNTQGVGYACPPESQHSRGAF